MPKTALVTIAIGDEYLARYDALFKPSHAEYCKRHGYDLIVCDDFLEPGQSALPLVSFQKALVGSRSWSEKYDAIIFVDADILINVEKSPDVVGALSDRDKIGIINEYSQPSPEERLAIQARKGWETSATDYYKLAGFHIKTDKVLNTGVMVMCPQKHGAILEKIYDTQKKVALTHPRGFHFEQSAIGWMLQKSQAFEIMDNRFNTLYPIHILSNNAGQPLKDFFDENFFIHFAARTYQSRSSEILALSHATYRA